MAAITQYPGRRGWWPACAGIGASAVSAILVWQAFPGRGHAALAFVSVAPVLAAIATAKHGPLAVLFGFVFGYTTSMLGGQWMLHGYRGAGIVYILAAVSLSYGIEYGLAAAGIRRLHRLGMPLTLAAPAVVVSIEYLRSLIPYLDQWFRMGLCAYRTEVLLQSADVAGVAGVSFVIIMVNGMIVDAAYATMARTRMRIVAVASGVVLAAACLTYGWWQIDRRTDEADGPVIAVANVAYERRTRDWQAYLQGALIQSPEMVVLPEGVCEAPLNESAVERGGAGAGLNSYLRATARNWRSIIVLGGCAIEPDGTMFNSAFVYCPDRDEPWRYDKMHLVPFGEIVPPWGGAATSMDAAVNWRRGQAPFAPGGGPQCFEVTSASGREFMLATPLCYEITLPDYMRKMVSCDSGGRKADVVACVASSGGFADPDVWEQHLAHAVFRAVENRVAVVKSDTGVSAIIAPSGRIVKRSSADGPGAIIVAPVPLDRRWTLYTRLGNAFVYICVLFVTGSVLHSVIKRRPCC